MLTTGGTAREGSGIRPARRTLPNLQKDLVPRRQDAIYSFKPQ
jgi:hypothetical protein